MEDYKLERLLRLLENYGLDEWYDYDEDCISFPPDIISRNRGVVDSIFDFLYDNRSWDLRVIDGAFVLTSHFV